MAPYTPLTQATTPPPSTPRFDEHEDLLEGLQNIPSPFHLALNGRSQQKIAAPNLSKKPKEEASLRDPSHFSRRLSISTTTSTTTGSRSNSPYPIGQQNLHQSLPKTWRTSCIDFYTRNQAILLVTLSQLFGALMNVTTRLLELEGPDPLEPFQILFARQGLTMILCTWWMWWKDVDGFPWGRKEVRGLLAVRALSGFWGIYGMYCVTWTTNRDQDSLQYLPVADAVVITFLAPSVAGYGCYIFLREPFPRSSQYASLISLLGVVLIARPTSFFSSSSAETGPIHHNATTSTNTTSVTAAPDYASYPKPTPTQRLDAIMLALFGVLGSAGAFTSIRYIGSRAHPLISVNYFSTFCTLISFLALTLAKPLHLSSTLSLRLPSSLRQWGMLLFLGVCGFTMQYLLTKGLGGNGKKSGARGMNMVYTNMLFAVALDRWVFGVVPGWWSLAGSGCILGCAVYIALGKEDGRDGRGERDGDEESRFDRHVREDQYVGDEEERRGMLSMVDGGTEVENFSHADRDVELQEISAPQNIQATHSGEEQ